MQLGIRAGREWSLARRLTWLTGLRLLVLTLFLALTATVYLGGLPIGSYSGFFAFVTVGVAYFVSAIYAIMLRRGRALPTIARIQLVTDQLTWTALVYISGGPTSGATSLYGLTCLSGAILVGSSGALLAAASATVTFVLLCAGFWLQKIPPPPDQPVDLYQLDGAEMGYPIFVNVLAIAVVTLLASWLAERLRTTGGRLQIATRRAEQAERLAALGRLAAGLAHEIRNPLGSIAGAIELLRTGGTLSIDDQKLCEIVERETARLNDLVTDMLDLSKPRAPMREELDLAGTARDVAILAERSGRGGDVLVRYDGPPSAMISADPSQMRQVIWNLVRNAIQVSAPGCEVLVKIMIEDGDELLLEVIDRGPGIPAEAREQLFDAFFTTRSQGMGIGLAVVKRIIDDHDFLVEVDSQEGEGTTFRIRIPSMTSGG